VQAVHDQQAGHEVVLGQGVQRLVLETHLLVEDLEEPLQPGTVEVGNEPDQLLGPFARHRPARRAGVDQRVDACPGGPQVG